MVPSLKPRLTRNKKICNTSSIKIVKISIEVDIFLKTYDYFLILKKKYKKQIARISAKKICLLVDMSN